MAAVYAAMIYASVAGVIAAAMKLLRLGQNGAQTLLTEVLTTGGVVSPTTPLRPLKAIGWFNPWMDIASARHEIAEARLFIS
jgi:urease accessory protein